MTARRKRSRAQRYRTPGTNPAAENLDFARLLRETGDLADNEEDQQIVEALAELAETDPDAIARIYGELDEWREAFVTEHGRDPEDADLEVLLEKLYGGMGDEAPNDSMDESGLPQQCSWCKKGIDDDQEVFGFGIRLGGVELVDTAPGEAVEFPLPHRGRVAKATVVAEDSPAREEGWDLVFMNCSQTCAEELQAALNEAQDIVRADMLN